MAQTTPSREVKLTFAQIAPPPGSMALRGVNPNGGIEFGMRSDEVASKAVLNLEYTPSPSLLPVEAAHEKRESVSNKIRKLKLSRFN